MSKVIGLSSGHLTLCPNAQENPSRGVIAPRAEGRSRRGEPLKGAKQSPEAVLEIASGAPRPRNDSLE